MVKVNVTTTADVQKYLSPTLKKDTEGLEGKAYIGKIFSNLGKIAEVKFHRIMHTASKIFQGGEWINNKAVLKKLEQNFKDISNQAKNGEISTDDKREISQGIGTMRAVCDLLKGTVSKKDQALRESLQTVEGDLNKLEEEVFGKQEDIMPEPLTVRKENERKEAEVTKKEESLKKKEGIKAKEFEDTRPKTLGEKEKGAREYKEFEDVRAKDREYASDKKAVAREKFADHLIKHRAERLEDKDIRELEVPDDLAEKISKRDPNAYKKIAHKAGYEEEAATIEAFGRMEISTDKELREEAQVKLRELIKDAYEVKDGNGKSYLEISLGQTRASTFRSPKDSTENKQLADIAKKDYAKAPVDQMKKDIDSAVKTIRKGFEQAMYDEDGMGVPDEVQGLIDELEELKANLK
jgi:hypothetical protein